MVWKGSRQGGSAAQEAVRRRHPRRQRGSEGAGRLGEWRGDDSAARRAPGGSESGVVATVQLGGRRAARRAEGMRLRSSEGAGRLGERRGGDCAVMKAEEEAVQSHSLLKKRELLLRSGCLYLNIARAALGSRHRECGMAVINYA